jgi:hypothetical protein
MTCAKGNLPAAITALQPNDVLNGVMTGRSQWWLGHVDKKDESKDPELREYIEAMLKKLSD